MQRIASLVLMGLGLGILTANAQDDHSNSRASGTAVLFGSDTAGKLDTATDQDWFQFRVTGSTTIYAYTSGATDTEAILYKAAVVEREFASNHAGTNFIFIETLTTGTYFVGITGGEDGEKVGPYNFHLRTTGDAIPLENFQAKSSLTELGQLHLYSFELKREGQAFLYSTGVTDVDGSLYTGTGNLIEGASGEWQGDNFMVKRYLPPGKYLASVNSGGEDKNNLGEYTLHVKGGDNAIPVYETSKADALSIPGELDLFRVEVPTKGRSYFFTTGASNTEGTVYTVKGDSVGSGADNWVANNFQVEDEIVPGTYFVAVEGGVGRTATGPYSLEIRKPSNAINLTKIGAKSSAIDPLGDVDYYSFVTKAGQVTLTGANIDSHATLLDADGQNVTTDGTAAGIGFRISENLAAGQYYLIVRGQNVDSVRGNYSLAAQFAPGVSTSLSLDGAELPGTSQEYSFSLYSTGAWKTTGVPDWVKLSPTDGNGDKNVTVTVSANAGAAPRTATIKFENATHVITQEVANFRVPTLTSAQTGKDKFSLTYTTDAGYNYQIFSSETLQGTWTAFGDLVKGTGSPVTRDITNLKGKKFYRVEVK